jgi:retinol dehydrogenase 12
MVIPTMTISAVTGATSGIGRAVALQLARAGGTVVLACRDRIRAEQTAAAIRIESGNHRVHVMLCDLSAKASVQAFAHEFRARFERLDVLVNNAGIMNPRRRTTVDGLEETFATNYLGAFILTNALLDRLVASDQGKVINVTSAGHRNLLRFPFEDLQLERRYGGVRAYNVSKAALVLFTYALAERLQGSAIVVNAVHPGIVHSNIWPRWPLHLRLGSAICELLAVPAEKGAEGIVHLAVSPDAKGITGKYFHGTREKRSLRLTYDRAVQQRLWAISIALAGLPG